MSDRQHQLTEQLGPCSPNSEPAAYSPPVIVRLGTLAELTQGGTTGTDDGFMAAGDLGSV